MKAFYQPLRQLLVLLAPVIMIIIMMYAFGIELHEAIAVIGLMFGLIVWPAYWAFRAWVSLMSSRGK